MKFYIKRVERTHLAQLIESHLFNQSYLHLNIIPFNKEKGKKENRTSNWIKLKVYIFVIFTKNIILSFKNQLLVYLFCHIWTIARPILWHNTSKFRWISLNLKKLIRQFEMTGQRKEINKKMVFNHMISTIIILDVICKAIKL